MNNFLAACMVLPMLLFFPMQFTLQAINHHKIVQFQSIVEAAKEQAKQDGYFTPGNISNMKSEIQDEFDGVKEGDIFVSVTDTPKYRCDNFDEREMISYEIGMPISELLAAPGLFTISGKDNEMVYYVRGEIASERLAESI